jgi:hypothetical protein
MSIKKINLGPGLKEVLEKVSDKKDNVNHPHPRPPPLRGRVGWGVQGFS